MHDDSVFALISHATEERLKYLIEQIKTMARQRENFSSLVRSLQSNLFFFIYIFY